MSDVQNPRLQDLGLQDLRQPSFDPFGEPMAPSRACAEAVDEKAERRGFRETRRAVLVFWALALILVGGRVLLTDKPASQAFSSAAQSSAVAQVETGRVVALR